MKKITLSLFSFALFLSLCAQETDYTHADIKVQRKPTLTQFNGYTRFDISVLTTRTETDKPGTGFNLDYQVHAGQLTQVADGGDFHVISLLQRYGGKMTSPSTVDANIFLESTVYDRYGRFVGSWGVNNEHFPVTFDKPLTPQQSGNADFIRKSVMEKAIEASLQPLVDGLFGSELPQTVRIASLDGVKKKPELQGFDDQIKDLKKALEKEGLPGFKTAATPFVPYWEKMSEYAGEGDTNEVKRAAYQNLALYHIAGGEYDKARMYIASYKPIDKQIKAMMGLVRYKNSDELEKLVDVIDPPAPAAAPNADEAPVNLKSKAELTDAFQFITIKGTATTSEKKVSGTYKGTIKIYKIASGNFGNVVSLDPRNTRAEIITTNAAGQPLTITTTVDKLDDIKSDDGTQYTNQKFGSALMGDAAYYFMMSTYTSPKITVYRGLLPKADTWIVRKTGDNDGVKSSLLGAWKNLKDYLSDCPALAEKFKADGINKKASIETLAKEYTQCK